MALLIGAVGAAVVSIVVAWRRNERYVLLNALSSDVKAKVQKYTVPFDRIELGQQIGEGYFGKVFQGTLRGKYGTKQPVAIKKLHGDPEIEVKVEFVEEAILTADFDNKHVLSLLAIVIDKNVPYVVLPLMDQGDLRKLVSTKRNSLTVGNLVNFSLQVAKGMKYLTSRKFVHRDLAARNCMINKNLLVKVGDFGLARGTIEKGYYRVKNALRPMPVKWMAIECLSDNPKFTEKTDVWSYGVLVWELMTWGKQPYSDIQNQVLERFLKYGYRLEKPPDAPEFICNLMARCWFPDENNRPRFKDIVKELKEKSVSGREMHVGFDYDSMGL